jgi:hypothetical protein
VTLYDSLPGVLELDFFFYIVTLIRESVVCVQKKKKHIPRPAEQRYMYDMVFRVIVYVKHAEGIK